MDRGALDHPLEGRGRHRLRALDICLKRGQFFINEGDKRLAQANNVYATGAHDFGRVRLVQQRQQKMFQCCQFMLARIRLRQSRMDGLL